MSWQVHLRPITLAEAEAEQDRLFDRPPRPPSPATIAALKAAEQPPLLAEDVAQIRAKQRPRAA